MKIELNLLRRIRRAKKYAIAIFWALLGALALYVIQQVLKHWPSLWTIETLKTALGYALTVVTTLAAIYGIIMGWKTYQELLKTINDFPTLISKICEMADEATNLEPLQILAYTPALGYLAEPPASWHKLFSALSATTDNGEHRAQIICLKNEDLDIWHKLFVGRMTSRGKIDLERAEKATEASEHLIQLLSKNSEGKTTNATVIQLPWHFMPGFYLFITKKRALVVTPLFLPFPKGISYKIELPEVQIMGIEYKKPETIKVLQKIYNFYASLPQSSLGEASHVVNRKSLDTWLKDSNATELTQHLLPKFSESYEKAKEGYEPSLALANGEVELVLRANVKTWGDGQNPNGKIESEKQTSIDIIGQTN